MKKTMLAVLFAMGCADANLDSTTSTPLAYDVTVNAGDSPSCVGTLTLAAGGGAWSCQGDMTIGGPLSGVFVSKAGTVVFKIENAPGDTFDFRGVMDGGYFSGHDGVHSLNAMLPLIARAK